MKFTLRFCFTFFSLFFSLSAQEITSIDPDSAFWNEYIIFTIRGQNAGFITYSYPGVVWFSNDHEELPPVQIIGPNTDTTLIVAFDIPGGITTGYYNVNFDPHDSLGLEILTLNNGLYIGKTRYTQSLVSIDPDSAYRGQRLRFKISGEHTLFNTISVYEMVWLSRSNNTIYGEGFGSNRNDSTMAATLEIPFTAATGYWDLNVQQGDGYDLLVLEEALFVYDMPDDPQFNRLTSGDICNDKVNSMGCSWVDFNNDGYSDLFVANFGNNNLYQNNKNGSFTKITSGPLVNDQTNSVGCSWGDFDNDQNLDLYVSNYSVPNKFYQNNGNGSFTQITEGNLVGSEPATPSSSWGDYNKDGNIDLFVSSHEGNNNLLFQNNGDSTFTKVVSGIIVNDEGNSNSGRWCDYDDDGYPDIYVANYFDSPNFLYHNNGDGTFSKLNTGDIATDLGNSVGSCWGDYDNDGDFDLFVSNGIINGAGGTNFLYRNNGNGTFTNVQDPAFTNDRYSSRGCGWADIDNDGDLDLFVANEGYDKNFLYMNNGNGSFNKITEGYLANDGGLSEGCSWGDYDNDGDMDLYVCNWYHRNFFYENKGNTNNWIKIKCNGIISNRYGIGTKIRILADINETPTWQLRQVSGMTGRSSQNILVAHFGLNTASQIDSLCIEWPSGIQQILSNLPVNQLLEVFEEQENTNFSFQSSGQIEAGITSLDQNTFYAPASGDKVYRFDSNGFIVYTLAVNGDVKSSTTVTSDHAVYIASTDNNLYSFNANGVTNPGWPIALGSQATASVAVDNNSNIYIGTDNNIFQAISASGSVLWSYNIAAPVYASAAISDSNTLYIVNSTGRLYAFDLNTLNPENVQYKWLRDIGGGVVSSPALDDQNHIYITTLDGRLVKILDENTFSNLVWEFQTGSSIESSPIIGDDYAAYFGCNNGLIYAVDGSSGDSIWAQRTANAVKSTGALVENSPMTDRLYIGSMDNSLYCISLDDGSIIWKYVTPAPITCPILFQNGSIYFGSTDGIVFSISDPDYSQSSSKSLNLKRIWNTFQGNNWRTGNLSDVILNIQNRENLIPKKYSLNQNFPNPFNPSTKITFTLPKSEIVKIEIYNMLGQKIKTILNEQLDAGFYEAEFNGHNMASGLYIYRIEAGEFRQMKKMILLK